MSKATLQEAGAFSVSGTSIFCFFDDLSLSCGMLRNHERIRATQRTDGNFAIDVNHQCHGLGDNRLVQAECPGHIHHIHNNDFHRLHCNLVLLERSKLGTDTCSAHISAFALQLARLDPQWNHAAHHDWNRSNTGSFSAVLVKHPTDKDLFS